MLWTYDRIVGVNDVEGILLVNSVVEDEVEVDLIQVADVLNNEVGLQGVDALR